MPVFKLVNETGEWLTNLRVSSAMWKPGDRIPRGSDVLEVVEVRDDPDKPILVVRSRQPSNHAVTG